MGVLEVYNVRDYGAIGDGVADDTQAIQTALNLARDAEGGEVFLPDGQYRVTDVLLVYSHTRIRCSMNAHVIRGKDGERNAPPNLIRSGIGDVAGYSGVQQVEVVGGIWDFNGDAYPSSGTAMTFGHCQHITIRDVEIINVWQYHCIEFNAVKHGRVLNCIFGKQLMAPDFAQLKEAVQLDLMKSEAQFPHYGLYDNTPCEDILIEGCLFQEWQRGIGSHSYTDGIYHRNIRIIGNHFENCSSQGVRAYYWDTGVIQGNTFDRCGTGIQTNHTGGFVIDGNAIRGSEDNGISVYDFSTNNLIRGNRIENSGSQGISLYSGADFNLISDNLVTSSGNHGIVVNASEHNTVSDNLVIGSSQSAHNTQDNIRITSSANCNHIQGNTCRVGKESVQPRYGVALYSNTGNWVTGNDLLQSGATGAVSNGGNGNQVESNRS